MENEQAPVVQEQEQPKPIANLSPERARLANLFSMAKLFSQSTIVPAVYQKNEANCFIACEIADRMGSDPFMVMQNLNIIQGKPSFGSTFIIATINTSGRFKTPMNFETTGSVKAGDLSCYAYATSKDGTLCKGPVVSLEMAKAEGWFDKNGSKWKTMPEVMIRYRAASFFGKQYCPEILMGLQSSEEIIDIQDYSVDTQTQAKAEIANNANKGQTLDIPSGTLETPKPAKEETKPQSQPDPEPVKKPRLF